MPNPLRKPPSRMTVADFVDWPGDGTGAMSQLIDGEVRTIPPGSVARSLIHTALIHLVDNHLEAVGSRYYALSRPPIIPRVRASLNLRTPVLAVTAARIGPNDEYNVPDPVLLIEILTPDNVRDVWRNVWAYCTIPSVSEIAVVHSTRMWAEVLRRGADGHWPEEPEQIGATGALRLESIGFACPLPKVYVDSHLRDGDMSESDFEPRA
jgi:Uma2 family endonuclease